MSKIQRWELKPGSWAEACGRGTFIAVEDHEAEIARLRKAIQDLLDTARDLNSSHKFALMGALGQDARVPKAAVQS